MVLTGKPDLLCLFRRVHHIHMSISVRRVVSHDGMPFVSEAAFQLHYKFKHPPAFHLKANPGSIILVK